MWSSLGEAAAATAAGAGAGVAAAGSVTAGVGAGGVTAGAGAAAAGFGWEKRLVEIREHKHVCKQLHRGDVEGCAGGGAKQYKCGSGRSNAYSKFVRLRDRPSF